MIRKEIMKFQEELHSNKSSALPLAAQNISMEMQEKIAGSNGIQMKIADNQRELKAIEIEKILLLDVSTYPDQ